jgi:hypothetical protein
LAILGVIANGRPAQYRRRSAAEATQAGGVSSGFGDPTVGASDEDRASVAMFYYGYLAAKAGVHIIDVSRIDGHHRGDAPTPAQHTASDSAAGVSGSAASAGIWLG